MSASETPQPYPRDLRGYGRAVPHARWPGGARIAVQFVLNYEEGGENSPLHSDPTSETFLSELITTQAYENRHMTMESMYEYGSRVGVWRILREFERRRLPLTVFGIVSALERYPELVAAFLENGYEIANHGLRWIHYQELAEATERSHVEAATRILRALTGGEWPLGWYTGRDSPNTRRLVVEHGGFVYDADSYADDLPGWTEVECSRGRVPHLVVPYALDTNDMRFATPQGFNSGEQFFAYLRDAFDTLYAEGDPAGLDRPKMLSV
ncbi:MAG: polysaccharide deacetylase family protein, partial [Rhizobacter sp.]